MTPSRISNGGGDSNRQSEFLDVQLLDAFAQIEALLRCGREVQREVLRVRGVPQVLPHARRVVAGESILHQLANMTEQWKILGDVLRELRATAADLNKNLQAENSDVSGT